jgi:hypothetical protein
MDQALLRLLIQERLADGRLPRSPIPRVWGGPGRGETCDGCGETVTNAQMVMENLDATGSGNQFHVACFHVWDVERQMHAHERPSGRLPARCAFGTADARMVRPWAPLAPSARPPSASP